MLFMALTDHLDKLKAFRVIAEAQKLSEATKRLHMSQPSLTRLIQTLEGATGTKLFHRSRQGVALTRSGQLLLEYSISVLGKLEDLEQRLKNPDLERAGVLRIGSYESLAEYLWPEFVLFFMKISPELKLLIRTSGSFNHKQALESGELDVLVDAEPRVLGDIMSWTLYEDRFNFYGVMEKLPSNLSPESIGNLPLIFSPSAFDRDNKNILQHLEERGYFFKEKMELDSFCAVRTFCNTGMGLAVLPLRLAESSIGALSQVSLKGFPQRGFGTHSICASVKSNRADDYRIRVLVKALRERFKK
jgi:DNA-binding transcriptional LysR family regulator